MTRTENTSSQSDAYISKLRVLKAIRTSSHQEVLLMAKEKKRSRLLQCQIS